LVGHRSTSCESFETVTTSFRFFIRLFVFLFFFFPSVIQADDTKPPPIREGSPQGGSSFWATRETLEEYVKMEAAKYNLPWLLVISIMEEESELHPWKVVINKHHYYARTKDEALRAIKENAGDDYNLGIMQVHSRWLKRFSISPAEAIDTHINIKLGLYVLNESLAAHTDHGKLTGKGVNEYRVQQGWDYDPGYARRIGVRYTYLLFKEHRKTK